MQLRQLKRNWDRLGRDDPMWAILSDSRNRGNRTDPGEFFASGGEEIDAALARASAFVPSLSRGRALDFGCGIGRLTRRLADHFDEVHGVDVAPAMIRQANEHVAAETCHFHVNDAADLSLFGDGHFDFIYSRLTIQHIPPNVAAGYIPEFGRVLAPGGLIMIQIPTTLVNNPKMWRRTVPDRVWDLWHDLKSEFSAVARCRMFGLPVDTVVDLLAAGGADVIHIAPNDSSGPEWHSYWYLATTRLTAAPSG